MEHQTLKIGQEVYKVCKVELEPHTPPCLYRKYISKKKIKKIELTYKNEVVYTAGNYSELSFVETEPGTYMKIEYDRDSMWNDFEITDKQVYLTIGDVRKEELKL
jgi:PP-loop superfamily ATP-utilizing enzyme